MYNLKATRTLLYNNATSNFSIIKDQFDIRLQAYRFITKHINIKMYSKIERKQKSVNDYSLNQYYG